jgi:hypothetical protein
LLLRTPEPSGRHLVIMPLSQTRLTYPSGFRKKVGLVKSFWSIATCDECWFKNLIQF